MSQKMVTTIVSVTPQTVNTKRGPAVKHEILTSGSQEPLQTFKQDIANTAMSLIGQPVEIEYDVSVNGEFTNFYPVSILPAANPALQAQMAQAAAQSLPGAQFAGQVAQQATPQLPQGTDYFADPKTLSIHRQKATDVAAKLITENSTPAGYWANVQALVTFYNSGATPMDLVDPDDPDGDIPF